MANYNDFLTKLKQSGAKFSDTDMLLAQRNPDVGLQILDNKLAYSGAAKGTAGDAVRTLANANANALRAQYGYSGGSTGSSVNVTDQNRYDALLNPDAYSRALNNLTNRSGFTYDASTDPYMQVLTKRYTEAGRKAADDTVGIISDRTGGLASSYASTAADQAYNDYLTQLQDAELNRENTMYSRYLDQYNLDQQALSVLQNEATIKQKNAQNAQDRIANYLSMGGSIYDLDKSILEESGYTDAELNLLNNYYQQLLYAASVGSSGGSSGGSSSSSRKSSSSGSSSSSSSGNGNLSTTDAGLALRQAIYTSGEDSDYFIRNNYKDYGFSSMTAAKEAVANSKKINPDASSGYGNNASFNFDEDEGVFTWAGKKYTSTTALANAINNADISDEDWAALQKKAKNFGFTLA